MENQITVNEIIKGNVYSHEEVVNYCNNTELRYEELNDPFSGRNNSSGHNFIKLVDRGSNKVITFILDKNYQYECVYNDFE